MNIYIQYIYLIIGSDIVQQRLGVGHEVCQLDGDR